MELPIALSSLEKKETKFLDTYEDVASHLGALKYENEKKPACVLRTQANLACCASPVPEKDFRFHQEFWEEQLHFCGASMVFCERYKAYQNSINFKVGDYKIEVDIFYQRDHLEIS